MHLHLMFWTQCHEDDCTNTKTYGTFTSRQFQSALILFSYDPRHGLLTVQVSFDRGESWPVKRIGKAGPGNYTWMAAGRKGTPSEGMIYLLSNKDWMARFNLAWLLQGQSLIEK